MRSIKCFVIFLASFLLFFILLIVGGDDGGTDELVNLPETVLRWKSKVTKEAEKNGIPEAVPYLLAIIMVETLKNILISCNVVSHKIDHLTLFETLTNIYRSWSEILCGHVQGTSRLRLAKCCASV